MDAVECVKRSFHRQCRYFEGFPVLRDGGDAGRDEEANVAELTRFLHHSEDLRLIRTSWIENGLSIVKDQEHFLGR